MQQSGTQDLTPILTHSGGPCVSLYLPMHPAFPESRQNPVRFRNSLKAMEALLEQKYSGRQAQPVLERFRALAGDDRFWTQRTESLALLGHSDELHVFDLQQPVDELLVVADRFHLKPLLRTLQSADRFQVLCLSRDEVSVFEGNRDALDPVELDQDPSTLEAALGREKSEAHQTVASYGDGAGGPGAPHGEPAMYHGHGGRKDERQIDRERFFRVVDRAILEHHSRRSGLPLILAAVPEHHGPFRAVSHNPFLLSEGIEVDPGSLELAELRTLAWKVVEPHYLARLEQRIEDFRTAQARHSAADDMEEVAKAAAEGRVGVLLVEAGRETPGALDRAAGKVLASEPDNPQVNDLLDELTQLVLLKDGEVMIVPAERMPTRTGVAAIFRY